MALLWCLSNPHVSTVILGASRLEQLKDNISALEARAKFSSELAAEIETVLANKPAGPLRY
jgi:aryl-alcohol dehydrogenase-like predicted oxidoreductase